MANWAFHEATYRAGLTTLGNWGADDFRYFFNVWRGNRSGSDELHVAVVDGGEGHLDGKSAIEHSLLFSQAASRWMAVVDNQAKFAHAMRFRPHAL